MRSAYRFINGSSKHINSFKIKFWIFFVYDPLWRKKKKKSKLSFLFRAERVFVSFSSHCHFFRKGFFFNDKTDNLMNLRQEKRRGEWKMGTTERQQQQQNVTLLLSTVQYSTEKFTSKQDSNSDLRSRRQGHLPPQRHFKWSKIKWAHMKNHLITQ